MMSLPGPRRAQEFLITQGDMFEPYHLRQSSAVTFVHVVPCQLTGSARAASNSYCNQRRLCLD